jgi:hypothetical protein
VTWTFDEPDEVGGDRINPSEIVGHLLLVWAVDYIDHSPTKFSKPDKKSDVVVVDVVDLDLPDENGYAGLLCRAAWWRQARLIAALRNRVGNPTPILAHMTVGQATVGNPPYELRSANALPECVARGQAWMAANPNFTPSPARANRPAEPPLPSAVAALIPPREPSILERLANQATAGASRITGTPPLPPPPPSPPPAEPVPY